MNLGVRWWRVSHGARAAGGSSTHPAVDLADVGEDAHEGLTQPSLPRHLRRTHQQWVHAADRANESTVCAASVRLLRVPMPLEALDEEILCGERPPSTQTETGGASREPQAEGPPWRVRTQRKKGGGSLRKVAVALWVAARGVNSPSAAPRKSSAGPLLARTAARRTIWRRPKPPR